MRGLSIVQPLRQISLSPFANRLPQETAALAQRFGCQILQFSRQHKRYIFDFFCFFVRGSMTRYFIPRLFHIYHFILLQSCPFLRQEFQHLPENFVG